MSAEGEFRTRAGHIQYYFQDCPASFGTVSNYDNDISCDWIWENPPHGIRARFAQCAFLVFSLVVVVVVVAQVEIYQSPDFVIYILNNPPNCCRLLWRLVVLYEGEISLHFDSPSRHSCRTRSPLIWALIRILYLDTARFINLLYVCSPFLLLGHLGTIGCHCQQRN